MGDRYLKAEKPLFLISCPSPGCKLSTLAPLWHGMHGALRSSLPVHPQQAKTHPGVAS